MENKKCFSRISGLVYFRGRFSDFRVDFHCSVRTNRKQKLIQFPRVSPGDATADQPLRTEEPGVTLGSRLGLGLKLPRTFGSSFQRFLDSRSYICCMVTSLMWCKRSLSLYCYKCLLKPGSHIIAPIVSIASIVCKYWDDRRRPKRSGVVIWSSRSLSMSGDLQKTIIMPLDPTQWQPSMKEQNSWPPIFSVIADLRRRREREARRIEHGRSKRSWSPQSPQTLAIVCVMFSYNRPDRKKTFWSDRGDRNDRAIIWEPTFNHVNCLVCSKTL